MSVLHEASLTNRPPKGQPQVLRHSACTSQVSSFLTVSFLPEAVQVSCSQLVVHTPLMIIEILLKSCEGVKA